MPPQTVTLAIWLLQQLIEHEPEIAASIKLLLTKAEPTDAEWDALHAKVAAKSYRDYVPDTALPLPAVAPLPALTPVPAPAPALSAAETPTPIPIRVLPDVPVGSTFSVVQTPTKVAMPEVPATSAQPGADSDKPAVTNAGPVTVAESPKNVTDLAPTTPAASQPEPEQHVALKAPAAVRSLSMSPVVPPPTPVK